MVTTVQQLLRPKFHKLLTYLSESDAATNPGCFTFFLGCLQKLEEATREEDVLAMFLELSNAAFLGFDYDEASWSLADDLLASAEEVALTMTADGQH